MMCSRVESSKVKASQGSVLSRSGSAGESGGGWITCGSVSGWMLEGRVCVMGINSPFGGRVGSGGGIVLFELLDGHITQKFVYVGRKKDGARRPPGSGSTRRRGRSRLPRGNGGDIRRPIKVSSVNLVEFFSWHVNATIGGA